MLNTKRTQVIQFPENGTKDGAATHKAPLRAPLELVPFTGKERDEETGYGYFGARYMDHELMTMWLSVDPMADKYPNISPYAYCAWNPIKLVDPDGEEIWIVGDDGNTYQYKDGKIYTQDGKLYEGNDDFTNKITNCLNDMSSSLEGCVVISQLEASETKYTYINKPASNSDVGGCFSDKTQELKVKDANYGSIAHETFHAYQYDCGMRGRTATREVGAFLFQACMIKANAKNKRWENCGIAVSVFQGKDNYFMAMLNLLENGFSESQYKLAVDSFLSESISGQKYKDAGYKKGSIFRDPPIKSILQR